jgi:hypothetical protein
VEAGVMDLEVGAELWLGDDEEDARRENVSCLGADCWYLGGIDPSFFLSCKVGVVLGAVDFQRSSNESVMAVKREP